MQKIVGNSQFLILKGLKIHIIGYSHIHDSFNDIFIGLKYKYYLYIFSYKRRLY